jgi:hypothetical protein
VLKDSRGLPEYQSLIFQVEKILKKDSWLIYEIAGYLLLICWIVSTIEAYYLGNKKELAKSPPPIDGQ